MSDIQAHLGGFRAGSVLAGYRLETQAGTGGMAVVFRARDERLNRLVALKILAPALAADSAFRSRFIAESRAAAAVDDPHIIPVYEAGEADGVLFIAMRFVHGGDLGKVLEREGPLPPSRTAEFISPVASALDAAHRAGLVHRDVKPANILVDAREDRPDHVYLSDFGASKAMSSAGPTGPGWFVGTPHYSAPEQIEGRTVDGRTDQYALACVTFQLLTGALPFAGDQGTVLMEHVSAPPPSLVSRMPDLPGAVDQVMAKAMAKAPENRYASCLDFAGALREALGLPPFDPQSSAVPRPASSPHPRRGVAAMVAWLTRHRLPAVALACAILAAGVIPFVLAGPAKSPSRPVSSPGPRESASPASSTGFQRIAVQLPPAYAGDAVSSLAFSPSGATLAIGDSSVCLWDIVTSTCTAGPAFSDVNSVAFSPDGKTLAVGTATGSIKLWDVAARRLTATLTDPGTKGVNNLAFSRDGKTLATADENGHAYLWDPVARRLAATLADPGSKGVNIVAFSPDGKTVATADFNGHAYLWNATTGTRTTTLADPGSKGVNSVAFSPDGKVLATADFNGHAYLWNATTGTRTTTLADPGSKGVNSVAFSPDGKVLATADENDHVYLWNPVTRKLTAILSDPDSDGVNAVVFSPDRKTVATGDESGTLWLWRLVSNAPQ